jgi:hypothetical protein
MLQNYLTPEELTNDLLNIKNTLNPTEIPDLQSFLKQLIANEKIFPLASNIDLINLLFIVFEKITGNLEKKDPWSNAVDPLTFILSAASTEATSLDDYSKWEHERQREKSVANHFGYFTQGLIRIAFKDCRKLAELYKNDKQHFDVESMNGEIAVEVKSKWNTTKGDTREKKYKEMWEQRGKFKELYFAEILQLPGHNYKPEKFLITDKYPYFWKCNGEFIYRRAAEYQQNISPNFPYMKTMYQIFPRLLWVFAKLTIHRYKGNKENLDRSINELEQSIKDKIKHNGKLDTSKKEAWQLLTDISTDEGVKRFLNDKGRCLPQERKQARELILQRDHLVILNTISESIRKSIERYMNSSSDARFLAEKLLGHL